MPTRSNGLRRRNPGPPRRSSSTRPMRWALRSAAGRTARPGRCSARPACCTTRSRCRRGRSGPAELADRLVNLLVPLEEFGGIRLATATAVAVGQIVARTLAGASVGALEVRNFRTSLPTVLGYGLLVDARRQDIPYGTTPVSCT